jgi:glycerol-3-phosphate cytidylyltransferase-like family protein
LNYGNRLFVGVMSDEDVMSYKHRAPIMTTEERCREVEVLRCVYKVDEFLHSFWV